MNEKIYEIFNIEPHVEETKQLPVEIQKTSEGGDDVEADYNLARNTLRDLVKKSSSTLDDAIILARNSEHPRAYEVVGQIIKAVSDVSKDLLALQKQKNDIKNPEETTSIKQQNNIVFAGSTQELMQLINQQKQIDAK